MFSEHRQLYIDVQLQATMELLGSLREDTSTLARELEIHCLDSWQCSPESAVTFIRIVFYLDVDEECLKSKPHLAEYFMTAQYYGGG